MARLCLLGLLTLSAISSCSTLRAKPDPPKDAAAKASMALAPGGPGTPVVSPEVHADRRVTFRLSAPKATEVTVRGIGSPPAAMRKDAAGNWTLNVGPLEPDTYHYHFMVDGVRTIDPSPMAPIVAGMVSSSTSSTFVIRGDRPAIDELLPVPHGVVHHQLYQSKSLGGVVRRAVIYTPPDYDSATKQQYPVLYLLHGARNNETFWTEYARVNLVVDNLIASGIAKPLVIVMPNGNPPSQRPRVAGMSADLLIGRDLVEDLIPTIESAFRVKADGDHRAIAGFSLGGRQALAIGLSHLGHFTRVATFSAAMDDAAPSTTFAALPGDGAEVNRKLRLLWMACGTEDALFAANENASTFLRERGIEHTFQPTAGAHSWKLARRQLHELVPKLFAEH